MKPELPDLRMIGWYLVAGAVIGSFVEVPALMLAIVSGGSGHGHYGAARVLFPISMFLTARDTMGLGLIVFGLVQFPCYGAILAYGVARRSVVVVALMFAVHGLAVVGYFSGANASYW